MLYYIILYCIILFYIILYIILFYILYYKLFDSFFMSNSPGNFVVMVMEQSGHILGPRDSLVMPLLFTLGFPPLGLIKYKTVDI